MAPVDLSDTGVERILDTLTAAGITVHQHETDGDHYIDLHLTPDDAGTRTVLCWYADRQGWRVTESDSSGQQVHCYPIGHVDLAAVVAETKSILGVEQAPKPTGFGRLNANCTNCGDERGGPVDHDTSACRYRLGMTAEELAATMPPDKAAQYWKVLVDRYLAQKLGEVTR